MVECKPVVLPALLFCYRSEINFAREATSSNCEHSSVLVVPRRFYFNMG
jgi:hypothetical protein